ncbi:hypothetical protein ACFWWB_34955 [Streptomyces sp. NPDC058690]|uniref:hypothetical protein n=1 Tax=Streptomyces sp. NPDC058690 TaxID=3346600 RepID=UPI00365F94F4
MRRAAGIRRRGIAAVAVLATVLTAAGCGTDPESAGSRTTGSADTADPGGKDTAPRAPASALTWEFEHIAEFSGDLTDVAVLAADDIWAVGNENNGAPNAHLLHYDGTQWKREPLPEALSSTDYPPVLEEVGEEALRLRPQTYEKGSGVTPWARWDGTRWSAVPNRS